MELINNTTKTLKDDLSVEIKQGSKLSIAAACFSIYAFQELKEQLSQIEELRFIFTSPTFVTEKAKKERREFYIPRLTRERNLYGTEFEIKLRNELTQKAIARECAEWIRQKVTFKSNVSDKSIQGQIVVDGVGYTPINNFTTVELGCEKGNVISTTIVKDESLARTLLADFNEIWNDSKVLQVVTDEVIDSMSNGAKDIAVVYSGDAAYILDQNEDMAYCQPEQGTNVWTDAMVIPKNAENPELANVFINFILEDKESLDNSQTVGYASSNQNVLDELSEGDYAENEAYLPRSGYDKDEYFHDNETLRAKLSELWIKIKAGN